MRFLYHHSTDLSSVYFGEIVPSPVYTYRSIKVHDPECLSVDSPYCESEFSANWWLETQVGFYPLFVAVGSTREDIHMTGYSNQWRRAIMGIPDKNTKRGWRWVLRKKGESPNFVLFSYKDPPSPRIRYVDYSFWFLVLNSSHNDYQISDQHRRWILKPSYKPGDWLRKARKEPHHVMGVVDRLDLRKADRIWVRNKQTAKQLEEMGFRNVSFKRMAIQD